MIQIEDYLTEINKIRQNQSLGLSKQQKFNDLYFKLKERNALNQIIIKKYLKKSIKKHTSHQHNTKQQLFNQVSSTILYNNLNQEFLRQYDSEMRSCLNNIGVMDQCKKLNRELENTNHTAINLYADQNCQNTNSLPYIHISFNQDKIMKIKEAYVADSKDLASEFKEKMSKQNYPKTEQHRKIGSSVNYKISKDKRYKTDKEQFIEGYKMNVKDLIFTKKSIQSQKKFNFNRQNFKKVRFPTEGNKNLTHNCHKTQLNISSKAAKKDITPVNRVNVQYSDYNISQKVLLPSLNTHAKIQRYKHNIIDSYINFNQYKNIHKEHKNTKTQGIKNKEDEPFSYSRNDISTLFKINTIGMKRVPQKTIHS